MAAAEEQIEIPTEVADGGEPLMPKKERKPHEKGITFREFDVSIFILLLWAKIAINIICKSLTFQEHNYLRL